MLAISNIEAQDFQISFAGTGSSTTVDSVFVENLTQGTELSVAGNDIVNLVVTVGESEFDVNSDRTLQVFPNPMNGSCRLDFETKIEGNASLTLFEMTGKMILQSQKLLTEGIHSFKLSGISNGVYFLKIASDTYSYSAKLISLNAVAGKETIQYIGTTLSTEKQMKLKNTDVSFDMAYTLDDYLKISGKSGIYRTVKILKPTQSQLVTFNFVPCTDADDNNYASLQIGGQIWMAENLNVGVRVNGNQQQTNNGIIEKYSYGDNIDNGNIYGGLYSWDEMMQYQTTEGAKGICPNGWHIPTNQEWTTLTNLLGGETEAGAKMKETTLLHWLSPNTGANNESGFSALPGGTRNSNGTFQDLGYQGKFWTSSQNNATNAVEKYLGYNNTELFSDIIDKTNGNTCRCMQNDAVELTKLAGETTKTWKLLRDVSTGNYPLEVGPYDRSTIWWAMGYNNDELVNRPCMLNDEWTFGRDGSMVFDAKGDYWAEGSVFEPANICASTDNMVGPNGEDLSAWGNGNHTFHLTTGSEPKLKVIGNGAYLGLCKVGTDYEFHVPQDSVTYDIVSLYDGTTDTLIVESNYYFAQGDTQYGGYWRFVLVHYDDPNDEPPMPMYLPTANFNYTKDGYTVIFQNTSLFATSYLWSFGDGETSTETNPTHNYTTEGFYEVTLTATNELGNDSISKNVFFFYTVLTNELLQGSAWRVVVGGMTVFVGPGMGNGDWWSVPLEFLNGEGTGNDDWSCMPDDEFTFSAAGVYTYETMGSARNDGYFGYPNGCFSDAQIAESGNGAAFGSSVHSYVFTPASGNERPIITLTNGGNFAAFIGFYKGYYGGENTDQFYMPNGGYPTNRYEVMGYANTGTKEYLFVSVDISWDHSGTAAWSYILER